MKALISGVAFDPIKRRKQALVMSKYANEITIQ